MCPEAKTKYVPWPTDPVEQRYIWQPVVQWLLDALAASDADYKIVAGHYHIYTNTD